MANYDNPRPNSQPIGSTDPAVVKDNLITVDFITESDNAEITTRTGKARKTLRGLEIAAEEAFRLGTAKPQGDYSIGVVYEKSNWTYTYNGQQWGLSSEFDLSQLPYTATEADPNNDSNLAVRGNVNEVYVNGAQEELLPPGSKIYPDNGRTLENGDTVPAGTTHLRVFVGGKFTIVAMYPEVAGVVSDLTDSEASIGGVNVNLSKHIYTDDLIGPLDKSPFLIAISGQSNAQGVNSGGPNPANPKVKVWDGSLNEWGSSDYTLQPFSSAAPTGNGGNSNIGLALAHRIQDATGRKVYLVYDAVGGTSIDEWVGSGTSSTRYAAIKTKVENALATPELSGKAEIDVFWWQQGEEDFNNTYQEYLDKLVTLKDQLRSELWMNTRTPMMIGEPSPLHDRYPPKQAMQALSSNLDANCIFVNSSGLETSDATHYTGDSLWEMGYYRGYYALNEVSAKQKFMPALFFGRGVGPADPSDGTVISSFSSIVSWDSKTVTTPPNSNAATGSISWGFECDADGNYTFAGGYQCLTDNLCNYSMLWGRECSASGSGDYSAVFGFQNQAIASYTFTSGRGNISADQGCATFGTFARYTTPQVDPVKAQIGTGTSSGTRENGLTVRESGTVEILARSTSADPTNNEELVFKRVDNFTLRLSLRGTDGIVRSADIVLS